MPLTRSLLDKLISDHPQITFAEGEDFLWSPETATVYYVVDESDADALLIHELAHGLLEHKEYSRDVQLIAMETDAWEKASALAHDYQLNLDDDTVQDHLDTYREWLHARSTCPSCEATGHQSGNNTYTCVACLGNWRVNEARICALRRYQLTK